MEICTPSPPHDSVGHACGVYGLLIFNPALIWALKGSGIAERFIRMLKQLRLWVRIFRAVGDLPHAVPAWLVTYNNNDWWSGVASGPRWKYASLVSRLVNKRALKENV